MARSRAFVGTALAVVVLAATSACGLAGFTHALAHPQAQQPDGSLAAPSTPSNVPEVIARAALLVDGRQVGSVRVATGRFVSGFLPPIAGLTKQCPVSGPSVQYLPVELDFDLPADRDGSPAGHLTVAPGPATPADIGDLGVFFAPDPDNVLPYCVDYPPLPTTDTFAARGTTHVTGYVVLDQAIGPGTPEGRPQVFPTLQVRLDDLRLHGYGDQDTPFTLGPPSTGAACPDDDTALCVALG